MTIPADGLALTTQDRVAVAQYLTLLRDSERALDLGVVRAFERLTPRQLDVLLEATFDGHEAEPAKSAQRAERTPSGIVASPSTGTHLRPAGEPTRSGLLRHLFGDTTQDMKPVLMFGGVAVAVLVVVVGTVLLGPQSAGDVSSTPNGTSGIQQIDPLGLEVAD